MSSSTTISNPSLILATRIHLGKQSTPPPQSKLNSLVSSLLTLASTSSSKSFLVRTIIAVDPAPKLEGYDLVRAIDEAILQFQKQQAEVECDVVPVTPWGTFVPALNALVQYAASSFPNTERILFISAETAITTETIMDLCKHVDSKDTLVAGAALPGHDYRGVSNEKDALVELNGRTTPWNTCAIWNLKKLALTGFPLVADGLHRGEDGSPGVAGIEEFSTILLSQQLHSVKTNKAKLVKVSGVQWDQDFQDEERKKWHESKMKSKIDRAEKHRNLLGSHWKGWVIHC